MRKFMIMKRLGIPYSQAEQRHSPERLLTFAIGNKLEDIAREALNGRRGKAIVVKLGDVYLAGNPDVIVEKDGQYLIYEIKSIKRESYKMLTKPLLSHEFQLSAYLWLAKRYKLNFYWKKGIVLYLPKQECKPVVKPFVVELTDDKIRRFDTILKRIKSCLASKKLPPRICPTPTCTKARNCMVKKICFKED